MNTHYDLIVVGGGLSGIAAAVAASRRGLNVLLIEQSGCLGGAIQQNLIYPFMRSWYQMPDEPDENRVYLSCGIFLELCSRWEKDGVMPVHAKAFRNELMKESLDRFVSEAGVQVLFHATLCMANVSGRCIRSIDVATKAGVWTLEADLFIDGTGDGDLMAFSGCAFYIGRESDHLCQPMTLCFRMTNVDMELYKEEKTDITPLYQKLQAEGKIKNCREDVLMFIGKGVGTGTVHFNSTRVVKLNPVDPFDLSRAEMIARAQMVELVNFLKENFVSFKDAYVSNSAVSIGVRESRKLIGEYVLTVEDLKNQVKFEDSIATGNYDIDIHSPDGAGTSHYYFPMGQYYTIPYRSLLPKELDNLLVSGRCISATHEAQASIRIMPICCCLGEAAGIAAAHSKRSAKPFREIDIDELHKDFDECGVRYR